MKEDMWGVQREKADEAEERQFIQLRSATYIHCQTLQGYSLQ